MNIIQYLRLEHVAAARKNQLDVPELSRELIYYADAGIAQQFLEKTLLRLVKMLGAVFQFNEISQVVLSLDVLTIR
jgi:hypothetical protein